MCWPRPDSSFVFGPLLDREKGGAFAIEGVDATPRSNQAYVENTNVLRTVFSGPNGDFEVYDFAPRFVLYDRYYKPPMLVRVMRPLSGEPRAVVRCKPGLRLRPARADERGPRRTTSSTAASPRRCG